MCPDRVDDVTEPPVDSLAALVERARSAIAGSPQTPPDGPLRGVAADGMVTAEVTAEGRVSSIEMDPKMMRRPSEEICDEIRAAVNEALDQRPSGTTGPILEELRAVQEQSVHEMAKISQAFTDALATVRRDG